MDGLLDPVVGLGAKWRAKWAKLGQWGMILCYGMYLLVSRSSYPGSQDVVFGLLKVKPLTYIGRGCHPSKFFFL